MLEIPSILHRLVKFQQSLSLSYIEHMQQDTSSRRLCVLVFTFDHAHEHVLSNMTHTDCLQR
jgi:hypothetical protein